MWNRKELKAKGKVAFTANYWPCVLVAFILILAAGGTAGAYNSSVKGSAEKANLEGVSSEALFALAGIILGAVLTVSVISILVRAFLLNPVETGCQRFFLVNCEEKAGLGELGYGFKHNYISVVKTMLLRDIYLFLWTCLFIIPGLIKIYSYRLVPYILSEYPGMGANAAITLSRRMMDGNKWKTFVFDLSFIGWYLLAAVTCGLVGVFYTFPYHYSSSAELYHALKAGYKPEQDR